MKPFKETKIGKFLSGKGLDAVLETVGDFVPGVAALDKLKDAVLGDPDTAGKLSQEEKERFLELYQLQVQELDLILKDVANARTREIELAKVTGHSDRMNWFLCIVVMSLLVFITVVLSFWEIPVKNEHVLMLIIGEILGFAGGIFTYQFGSSIGSRIKDMIKK